MTATAAAAAHGRAERDPLDVDVAVLGGGLAGLATAIQLARTGQRVVCVEPRPWPRPAVGESLEFSAPQLLADLGIELDVGGDRPLLYPKTSVRIVSGDEDFTVWPPPWFARRPIRCAGRTFHTDRVELDHQLLRVAVAHGAEILPERVATVDHAHGRITAVSTERGTRLRARWYVDATGHRCRLLGRALGLDREPLGAPRTAFWARLPEEPDGHATTLHFPRPEAPDLTWAWEIPLNDGEVSVGLVLPAARFRTLRREGLRPRDIVGRQLDPIPRLHGMLRRHPGARFATTHYTPYRHHRPAGPNWLLVGDASAMVDPLTSNGVTSALRHAESAALVVSGPARPTVAHRRRRWAFRQTAPAVVPTLDRAIETFVYDETTRRRLGLRRAVTLYAATGVITNALYARLRPTSAGRSLAGAALLRLARIWTGVAGLVVRRFIPYRHRPTTAGPRGPAHPSDRRASETGRGHADAYPQIHGPRVPSTSGRRAPSAVGGGPP